MPSGRANNFPESGRGLGHVTPTILGSTVGYPSDSLASCNSCNRQQPTRNPVVQPRSRPFTLCNRLQQPVAKCKRPVTVTEKLSVMWMTPVSHVHGPCMLSASCVHTACAHHYCSRSFSQSSSQSSPTLLRCGGVFRRLLISCASVRRAARSGLWESVMTAEELVDDADERLFSKVRHCAHHVLEDLFAS